MNVYTEVNVEEYERVIYCENSKVGLRAWVAVHSTKLGPALGGCRMWNYDKEEDAMFDLLRLSKGMTYKNALANLDLGGGKSVIWADAQIDKTPELFEAMGEFVEYLGGIYIIAEDVGITVDDVVLMGTKTSYTASRVVGNPGPFTARGIYAGIIAACEYKIGMVNNDSIKIAIQGAGSVGYSLAKCLAETSKYKFDLIVGDINDGAVSRMVTDFGATAIEHNAIFDVDCDVFAPCALGGILNNNTIPRLKCAIVAGSSNNQLLEPYHADDLMARDILYAPDYVINAGGVIAIAADDGSGTFDTAEMVKKIDGIGNTLKQIFIEAEAEGVSTPVIADRIAERRLI